MGKSGRDAQPWDVPGRFLVSELNYRREVQSTYSFPGPLRIHDGTLRKMEHASGAPEYTTSDKVEIARALDAVGVEEIGANPGQYTETVKGQSELEGVRAICRAGLRLKIRVADHDFRWLRGEYTYIDTLIDYGVAGIDLTIGSQSTDLVWGTGLASLEQAERAVANALEYIAHRGTDAGVMIADIGRIDLPKTLRLMNTWLDCGAQRYHLVDSLSTMSPEATRFLVRQVRSGLKRQVPTPYHVHNDFGMATACAIAAASAGAWPETSVNGFGDRGFASFEEVVLALELLYGVKTGIRLDGIAELSSIVERITHSRNHPNKPITGSALWSPQFTNQYKQVLAGQDCIASYISSFNPEVVGARLRMMWSANTLSRDAVQGRLAQRGVSFTTQDVVDIIAAVRERVAAMPDFPAWITDSEFDEISGAVLSG